MTLTQRIEEKMTFNFVLLISPINVQHLPQPIPQFPLKYPYELFVIAAVSFHCLSECAQSLRLHLQQHPFRYSHEWRAKRLGGLTSLKSALYQDGGRPGAP